MVLSANLSFRCRTITVCSTFANITSHKKSLLPSSSCCNLKDGRQLNGHIVDKMRRGFLVVFVSSGICPNLCSAKIKNNGPYNEKRLLEQNRQIQRENNAPIDFPNFVREGFQVRVVTSENFVKRDSGLLYWDMVVGEGDCPEDGQQVTFHYIGYNESGHRIDSTYSHGSPAKIRMGVKGLVPGFEEGIRDMRPGGKRRIVIPPELGPPVGPSTFFSAKQFEVFDVELVGIRNCQRRTIAFYSDIVCN